MSNRRAMLFFTVGILLLGGFLLWLELRSRRIVPDARADVLCAYPPSRVDACFVRSAGQDEVEIARGVVVKVEKNFIYKDAASQITNQR